MERVRAFLIQAALLKSLWAEVPHFVIWLKNCTTTWVIGDATPLEQVSGHKPNLVGLPEWGQHIWVHSGKSSKLQKHATIACWIGYNWGNLHAHQIYWLETQSITTERNVRFTADFTTVYTLPRPIQVVLLQLSQSLSENQHNMMNKFCKMMKVFVWIVDPESCQLLGSTIHTNIFIILQNLFIMLCWFSESDWLSCSNTTEGFAAQLEWTGGSASAKINISYSILFNITTSYSSYFGGKKGISRDKTSFFSLMWKSGEVIDSINMTLYKCLSFKMEVLG